MSHILQMIWKCDLIHGSIFLLNEIQIKKLDNYYYENDDDDDDDGDDDDDDEYYYNYHWYYWIQFDKASSTLIISDSQEKCRHKSSKSLCTLIYALLTSHHDVLFYASCDKNYIYTCGNSILENLNIPVNNKLIDNDLYLLTTDDSRRVKLGEINGDPNTDYYNASYITVSFEMVWIR